ncbi:MAG: hypothetical protein LQ338_001009 [Usnochroma carphineum]|nr:MAG: hypothetical protein LQ338_001009 [Usnochroma carphineum]
MGIQMSSVTGLFKRARSKSEKGQTPPKVVFGDLGSAYASITQKGTPSTPNLRGAAQQETTWSPVQSPQSEVSPSAPLLQHMSPDAIRLSHLSGDLFIPTDMGTGRSEPISGQAADPFSTSGQDRRSISTLGFKKQILDSHFGTTGGESTDPISGTDNKGSSQGTNLLSPSDYPELTEGQLEACSKLEGADGVDLDDTQPLDRCGTIQSLSTRHEYGQVGTNDDIRSLRGSHVKADDTEDEHQTRQSENAQQEVVEEVEWSPRPSSELYMLETANVQGKHASGAPPTMALPETPKGKGALKYGELQNFSSPNEQVSHTPDSYGNTRKLLDLSLPQIPRAGSQRDDFFGDLLKFAREGQSSSSSKSFATFSIKEANGNVLTRPVSQGEFQHLENAISSHLRRESQASNLAAGGGLLHVGQISLDFPEGSDAGCGPGSSQTTSSSEFEPDVDYGAFQPALRTRNGTPPLLFGGSSASKRDADWETVGDSNMTSSVADYSDTATRSPPKSLLSVNPNKVLKRPTHPRYNHSWDLQQDLRSGAYVLTPHHKVSGGISFPNNNGAPLSFDGSRNYSHPTPLRANHSHPFASSAPHIASSQSAGGQKRSQHIDIHNTNRVIGSPGSSAWLSTTDALTSHATTSSPKDHELPAAMKAPPLPTRNPFRRMRKFVSDEEIELQSIMGSRPHLGRQSLKKTAGYDAVADAGAATSMARASGSAGPSGRARLRSPHRRAEGKHCSGRHLLSLSPNNLTEAEADEEQQGENVRGAKERASDQVKLLGPFGNGQAHLGAFNGASAGDLSVSSYATTDDAPPSTSPAGSEAFQPDNAAVTPPADAILADTITPPRRHARRDRQRRYSPVSHPVYSHGADPEPIPEPISVPYEQRLARRYLAICSFLPILLPLYASGALDFLMRHHTRGSVAGFPAWEKQACWGILVAWVVLALCVVPFAAFVHYL